MKKIKMLTIILAIVLVTLIAVLGIYIPKQNRMENILKDYTYGMDLKGAREIIIKPDTTNKTIIKDSDGKEVEDASNLSDEEIAQKGYIKEEVATNSSDVLTEENYKESKEIIEKRFKKLKIENYEIRLDTSSGYMVIRIPENDDTDNIVSNLATAGKFEIADSETKEVLMNNDDIKKSTVMYGSDNSSATSSGTMVYLDIEFNKQGAKKLEDISGKYTNTTSNNTNTENTSNEANSTNETENTDNTTNTTTDSNASTEKKITMKVDDQTVMTTSFDEPLRTGRLQLSIGAASTDSDTIQEHIKQAQNMATILDTGDMPITYTVDVNTFVNSDISNFDGNIVLYVMICVLAVAFVILLIKYKSKGLIGEISLIGLAALLAIILKYTNVVITIEGLFGIAISLVLAFIFIDKLLSNLKNKNMTNDNINSALKKTYAEFFVTIIPVIIAVITFSFSNWEPLSSFGMVAFWGISLIAIYNIIVSNMLLKSISKK